MRDIEPGSDEAPPPPPPRAWEDQEQRQWRRGPGPRGFGRPAGPPAFTRRPAVAPAPPLEEGEELVAGRRPVEEAFAAGRPARRLLVTPARRQALEKIVLHATTLRIPIVEVEGGSLTALAGFDGHQGVAVVVDARRFASTDDILARAIERGEAPFVLVLDSLEDPQNVGTLLRSAEAAGAHGVIFPTERQAPLSPAAVKASAGATEHLLLAPVDDLAATLTDLHLRGLRIIGSDADAALSAREADLRGASAIVVGSEGHGLSPAIRRRCDLFVRIPMRGTIGSLNAAVAGSILLFEALGQRDPGARPRPQASAPPPAAEAPAMDAPAPTAAPKRRTKAAAPAEAPAGPGPVASAPEALSPEALPSEAPVAEAPASAAAPKRRTRAAAPPEAAEAPAPKAPNPKRRARPAAGPAEPAEPTTPEAPKRPRRVAKAAAAKAEPAQNTTDPAAEPDEPATLPE